MFWKQSSPKKKLADKKIKLNVCSFCIYSLFLPAHCETGIVITVCC